MGAWRGAAGVRCLRGWQHVRGTRTARTWTTRPWTVVEWQQRWQTTEAPAQRPPPQDVAVLGGGLTGLATAYYLAELLPATTRITLYEGGDRLGGWIDSEVWEGGDQGPNVPVLQPVILEAGARMVAPQRNSPRYDDLVFLDLVDRLDLADALLVSNRRPAQYVYYPDHLVPVGGGGGYGDTPLAKVTRLAGLAYRMVTEPVFAGLARALLGYALPSRARAAVVRQRAAAAYASPANLPPDESVGDFAVRQLGGDNAGTRGLVNNLLGAVMHGIYGGDVWRLSVASSPLRGSWVREAVAPLLASWVRTVLAEQQQQQQQQKQELQGGPAPTPEYITAIGSGAYALAQNRDMEMVVDLLAAGPRERFLRLAGASAQWTMMGFRGGFGTLPNALAGRLVARPNVTLRLGGRVTGVAMEGERVAVTTATAVTATHLHDKVIATLAAPDLYAATGNALPGLRDAHAVTIMVVNLHYAAVGLVDTHGFGYLVPPTVPLAENPECALGVLFDTDRDAAGRPWEAVAAETDDDMQVRFDGDDPARPTVDQSPTTGTTLTVMLGGHYWDDYGPDDYPSAEAAVAMAEAVVRRHLRWPADTPAAAVTRTKLCRGCIPQHYVGHAARLATVDGELRAAFGGRLAVAGGSYTATGPGVLPSLRAARDVALQTAGRGYRRHSTDGPAETAMEHVGDTGLGRFGNPGTDGVSPVPVARLPLRYGNGGAVGRAE